MDQQVLKNCAKMLKSLSEDTRLRIVKCLFKGEYSVTEIADMVERDHSQVSHHLGVLRNSGIVADRRDGKYIYYRLDPEYFDTPGDGYTLDFKCCRIGFSGEGKIKLRNN